MHHALIIVSRIVAFGIGWTAVYFALFLYEPEEGVWQNRIENLWASVYDRAKVTESMATALFNKVGETLKYQFNRMFGEKLLSFRSFLASSNISLCGCFFMLAVIAAMFSLHSSIFDKLIIAIIVATFLSLAWLFLKITTVLSGPFAPVASVISSLPLLLVLASSLVTCYLTLKYPPGRFPVPAQYIDADTITTNFGYAKAALPLVFLISFAADYCAILLMRKLFSSISVSVSIIRIILMMLSMFLFSLVLLAGPMLLDLYFRKTRFSTKHLSAADFVVEEAFFLNVGTIVICFIPTLMLGVVLLHKITWPLLSRLLYPVAARRVITNRKLLMTIASLCFTYAFNLEVLGFKEIIKLFPKVTGE